MSQANGSSPESKTTRLISLDTFRGLIMFSLAINGFALAKTADKLGFRPGVEVDSLSGQIWQWLAFHNSHPDWNSQFFVLGCSYWDLIQPSFMFMVGVAMPYSYASRRARGDSNRRLTVHAAVRSIVLVLVGVYLQTRNTGLASNRIFTNVLSQIGLGYFFVFLLIDVRPRIQMAVGAIVLLSYWGWMVTYPISEPPPQVAVSSVESLSVPVNVAKQFAKTNNAAAEMDAWILNRLLTPEKPIMPHAAGYATLNFIPSAVTILLGLLAGTLLRSPQEDTRKLRQLILGGVIAMATAVVTSLTLCPIIKKIWTPTWVLYSGAWTLWILAALYWLVDVRGHKKWTYPFIVLGANSLAIYLMTMLFSGTIRSQLKTYLGADLFGGPYEATIQAIAVFSVLWLICLYLYRNRLFLRV